MMVNRKKGVRRSAPVQSERVSSADVGALADIQKQIGDMNVLLQKQIGDLSAGLRELNATVAALAKAFDSTNARVDALGAKVDEFLAWKNKVSGGMIVISILIAALGAGVYKLSGYLEIRGLDPAKPVIIQPRAK